MEYKDYYKALGVDRTADDKAIKTAYRRLARKHHPDVNRGNAERFKEISEAYTVLSDPEKRKRYDTLGPDWERYAQAETGGGGRSPFEGRPFGGSGGRFTQGDAAGFSDFFRTIFGDLGGFRRAQPGAGPSAEFEFSDLGDLGGGFGGGFGPAGKGSDVEAGIQLTLEEAFQGTRKAISIELNEPCPQCGNPYLLHRERKSGNVFACDKAGCGFEKPPGALPPMTERFLEAAAKPAKAGSPRRCLPAGDLPGRKPSSRENSAFAGLFPIPRNSPISRTGSGASSRP